MTGIATTVGTAPGLTPGALTQLRVIAHNALGGGDPSDSISLTPATLPVAPASITLDSFDSSSLSISWPIPTDTGIGDQTVVISDYMLQVDEGFGDGFEDLIEQTGLSYTHLNLILGHTYSYRVAAQNFLGYGSYSTTYAFTPTTVPAKPLSAPENDPLLTTKTEIHITYDIVSDDGGAAITHYNVYVDDGLSGAFSGPYNNGLLTTYDTSALTLTSGRTYRLTYAAENSNGEGEHSDEVLIMMA